jgi:unsaturated rhamnogalacturonyl hydrolase
MKNFKLINKLPPTLWVFFLLIGMTQVSPPCNAQVTIGLDNWFNLETHPKTGKPFHYLWGDTADSGFSRWGEIFTGKGARIITVTRPDSKILNPVDVYIIVDPDSTAETPSSNYILPEDGDVIEKWVGDGGVLVLMANDGTRCEFTHLNQFASRFGMIFNPILLNPVLNKDYEMGAITGLPDHPLFKGISKIYMKEISSLILAGTAKPILSVNGQPVMAETWFGKGFILAVGDPWIYNEYIDHDRLPVDFENRKAAENLTEYLLQHINR